MEGFNVMKIQSRVYFRVDNVTKLNDELFITFKKKNFSNFIMRKSEVKVTAKRLAVV